MMVLQLMPLTPLAKVRYTSILETNIVRIMSERGGKTFFSKLMPVVREL